jgi:cupin 2 domain-containing protein
MQPIVNNILTAIPGHLPEELFQSIYQRGDIHIERILSKGHITPDSQWYDQSWDEWLLLVQGQATLQYQKNEQRVHLVTGDYLLIPSHTLHRVEWTPPDLTTIWLAIHLKNN